MAAFYTGTYTQATLPSGAIYYVLQTSGTLTLDNTNGYPNGAILQSILLVGGGGGSGNDGGGGGGGVAFASSLNRILNSGSYTVTIGDGGPGSQIFSAQRGGDTSAFGYTAVGSPSAQFNANNNNGANGSGSCDSTVVSSYGNAPTGQPSISGFTTYGGNAGGFHGGGRGSGSGGGATQAGSGTNSPGGNGVQINIGNTNNWYAVGGRSSYGGGGTNNSNWSASSNTGNGGTSNTNGYSGVVHIILFTPSVGTTVNANILVIGGGGSGGCFSGGGSGGAVLAINQSISSGSSYGVVVGAGGVRPVPSSRLDESGQTLVYAVEGVAGNSGGTSSFGSLVSVSGGSAGGSDANQGGVTGSGVIVPSGATVYSRTTAANQGGANGTSTSGSGYQGGAGNSVTINGVNYAFGGGGSGCAYWNVGGSTPGGRTPGGVTGGGRSGLVAGDRSNGVNPPAGNPPVPNTNSYSPGEDGAANTGGGGGAAARAEIVFSSGTYGVLAGSGGSGRVVVSYQNSTVLFSGGTITSTGSGVTTTWTHDFTTVGSFSLTSLAGTYSGFGGNGGALGQAGNAGGTSSSGQTGGAGGAAGKAINNPNANSLTIINNGQIYGAQS